MREVDGGAVVGLGRKASGTGKERGELGVRCPNELPIQGRV
jgi:hypothetical protein